MICVSSSTDGSSERSSTSRIRSRRRRRRRAQELGVDRLQLGGDRVLQREPVALERAGDPRERHAEGAERHDLVQPADVGLGVAPVASLRPLRGPYEPDLVVVVQRANGEPGALRELTDTKAVVGCCLVHGPPYDLTQRQGQGVEVKDAGQVDSLSSLPLEQPT